MRPDTLQIALEETARRFSKLWHVLNHGTDGPHSPETRRMLVDRVRDALDRGQARLADTDGQFIANSFALDALVHQGPTTEVHRARHRDLGTFHAIKMIRPDCAGDAGARDLLLREAAIGLTVRHGNVASTQTVIRLEDGRPALVMEWLEHRLSTALHTRQLSAADVIAVITAILSGLDAIHAVGFVHCDLSPVNLLMAGKNLSQIKIADFGIALGTGHRHGELDLSFAGQPNFASPEQKAGQPLDGRSDLYSAGLLLSLLLRHCSDPSDKIEALKAISIQLSRKMPADRPQHAKAALMMLANLGKSDPIGAY
ncbi:serine/threonine protein kinase [Neorhizobium lilium]|uniref:Serine/threonine protein kinase n=1 Tax=Neorhizobium lilium TaxID=2503024 RepID=A0A3S3SB37_9HYPH|nr:serine/threonine-protein kinase [Neorhizobium lilium]RWX81505.1 serine/threonine protein kinase [Neorhizobium lilium]